MVWYANQAHGPCDVCSPQVGLYGEEHRAAHPTLYSTLPTSMPDKDRPWEFRVHTVACQGTGVSRKTHLTSAQTTTRPTL